MDPEEAKALEFVLAMHGKMIFGLMYAQSAIVKELIDQSALDKPAFLESIKKYRAELADAQLGQGFDGPLQLMAKTVLEAGDDKLPADWLARLLAHKE